MKTIVKDVVKREAIKQELIAKFAAIAVKTNNSEAADQWKPMPEFPIYVIYILDAGGPYVVGFESQIKAAVFANSMIHPYERDEAGELQQPKPKAHVLDIAFCDSFPWEVMANASKKTSKQQSKPKKQ